MILGVLALAASHIPARHATTLEQNGHSGFIPRLKSVHSLPALGEVSHGQPQQSVALHFNPELQVEVSNHSERKVNGPPRLLQVIVQIQPKPMLV